MRFRLLVRFVAITVGGILCQSHAAETGPSAALETAAETGDVGAQQKLGDFYRSRFESTGYAWDRYDAETWYRKAARQGRSDSRCELARLLTSIAITNEVRRGWFIIGNGTPEVRAIIGEEAIAWYRVAAPVWLCGARNANEQIA